MQAEWHYDDQVLEVGVNANGEVFAFADDSDGNTVFELEGAWFIPNAQRLALRRYLYLLAKRVKDCSE